MFNGQLQVSRNNEQQTPGIAGHAERAAPTLSPEHRTAHLKTGHVSARAPGLMRQPQTRGKNPAQRLADIFNIYKSQFRLQLISI